MIETDEVRAARREANRASVRRWAARNRERKLAARRAYESTPARQAYLDNTTERRRAYSRAYYQRNKERWAARAISAQLRRFYGVTVEQYEALLAAQGGACAICRRPERRTFRGKPRRLAVDHDHTTGRVRGLLCMDCNTAIGFLDEDLDRLAAAAAYLRGP